MNKQAENNEPGYPQTRTQNCKYEEREKQNGAELELDTWWEFVDIETA